MICNKCNGQKEYIMNGKDDFNELSYIEYFYKCPRCLGKGKLDWIEIILKPDHNILIEKRIVSKPNKRGITK